MWVLVPTVTLMNTTINVTITPTAIYATRSWRLNVPHITTTKVWIAISCVRIVKAGFHNCSEAYLP